MKRLLCITLWWLFFLPQTAQAIVSIDQTIADSKQQGLTHQLHLALDGASGNTEKNSIKADLLSQWRHGQHVDFLIVKHAYAKSSGAVNTDRTFLHLRHRTELENDWAAEVFVQTGRDNFTRLSNRSLAGGGARFTAVEDAQSLAVYLGLGAFYESEILNKKVGTTDLDTQLWRGNFYLVFRKVINEQVGISSTTYYQPSIEGGNDYRLLEEASARIQMFENVELKLSIDYTYDSRPPQTVKPNDFRYSTGFEIRF